MRSYSRRGFLALSAGGLLVACGGSSGNDDDASAAPGGRSAALVAYFPQDIHVAGQRARLPFGIADKDGVPMSDGPTKLDALVKNDAGDTVATVAVARHVEGLPRAYYPLDVQLAEPGIYTLATTIDGMELTALFSIAPPGTLTFPGPGEALPPFDTPTVADNRGVTPLCTQPEPCPFHAVTLREALASGKPVAYLVGTPAHCQTGICGPILDLLIAEADKFPNVAFVHAEVYADEAATVIAPAVDTLGLQYEPLLFLTGADGVVRHRLDVIYDTAELREKLTDIAG